jgi:hypothetical protein
MLRAAIVPVLCLLSVGCGRTIVDSSIGASVEGRVGRPGGDAVANATVTGELRSPECGLAFHSARSVTRADGEYSLGFAEFGAMPRQYCLRIRVEPPDGIGLSPAAVRDTVITLDSAGSSILRIDIELVEIDAARQ